MIQFRSRFNQNVAKSSVHGLTSIELALALPVLALFIVGAVDISKSFKVYGSLQESVDRTIRCATTSDGECSQTTAPDQRAIYRWYQIQNTTSFPVDRYDYRATAAWLQRPTVNFAAQIPTAIHFSTGAVDFAAKRWAYRGAADLITIVRGDSGPYLDGTEPRNPVFVYANNTGAAFPKSGSFNPAGDAEIYVTPGNPALNNDLVRIPVTAAVEDATLPAPQLFTLPCFRARPVDFDRPRALNSTEPETDFDANPPCGPAWGNGEITGVIHVRGRVRGAGAGQLRLQIHKRNDPPGTFIDLGGQAFDGPGAGLVEPKDFYPRGAMQWNEQTLTQAEFTDHRAKVRIPIMPDGTPGAVVRVLREPGWPESLTYTVEGVDLYLFGYRAFDLDAPCLNQVGSGDLSAHPELATCVSSYGPAAPLTNVRWDTSTNADLNPPISVGCHASENAARDALPVVDKHNYIFTSQVTTQCSTAIAAQSLACPGLGQSAAPGGQPNLGVPESADANGRIYQSPRALEICPPPPAAPGNLAPVVLYWQESTVALPATFPNPWSPADCASPRPDMSAYPKIIATTTYQDFFPTSPGDPTVNPAYACADFRPVHEVLDDPEHGGTVPLPAGSLFRGPRPELAATCEESMLHSEASAAGIPAGAFLELSHTYATTGICSSENHGQTAACPTGECYVYRIKSTGSGQRTAIPGPPLPDGVTPPECDPAIHPGVTCIREFESFSGTPGQTTLANVENYALQTMEGLYPSTKRNCTGVDCVAFRVAETGSSVALEAEAQVKLWVLGGQPITLRYQQQREKEAIFAR